MVEIKCCHLWREKMNLGTCIMIWWILHAYNVSIEQFLSWNKLKRCWKSPGNGVLMPWKGKNWRYQNWSYSCPPANSHVQNSAFVDHVPKESHGFFHIGFFDPVCRGFSTPDAKVRNREVQQLVSSPGMWQPMDGPAEDGSRRKGMVILYIYAYIL